MESLQKIIGSSYESIRKKLLPITCASIMASSFLNPTTVTAQDIKKKAEESKDSLVYSLSMEIEAISRLAKISNVPEYVRDVPAHPDDSWASENAAPIDDIELNYPLASFNIDARAGIEHDYKGNKFEFGGDVKYNIAMGTEIKSRNYMGAPGTEERGYGTALTYYGFSNDVTDHIITPGAYLRYGRELGISKLFFEYGIEFFNLNISNGWDRHDHLDARKTYKLADVTKHNFGIGIEPHFNDWFFTKAFLGYAISDPKITPLGNESNLDFRKNNFVGRFSVGVYGKR